ncbi:MAG: hypothetical protein KDA41_02145, partial [Planctomycetales bacterium]|nr:hypothetical protein [Planctomycetales bacterium]
MLAMLTAAVAHAEIPTTPIVLPTIANADFETDAGLFVTFPGYTAFGANPAEITSWAGGGGRGINPGGGAGTPFRDNGNNGTNVAFLQGNGSNIAQTISGFDVGESYRIAFDYNNRNSGLDAGITASIAGSSFVQAAVPP